MRPGRIAGLTCLLIAGCAAPKPALTTETPEIAALKRPVIIFSIGYWGKKDMILTLTDARKQYLVIRVHRNDSLRTGNIYLK